MQDDAQALSAAARAVELVMAPVAAELAGESDIAADLIAETVADGHGERARLASITVIELFLTTPAAASKIPQIVAAFPDGARDRYDDVTIELGCLALRAGCLAAPLGPIAGQMLDESARRIGDRPATQAAIAGSWWAILAASRLANRDPMQVLQQVGLAVAGYDR